MADINRVVLVGRLTKDAELKYTSNTNMPVSRLAIAVNARRKQGDQWVDEAHFFDVTLFGKQGEALNNYLTKGKQVGIEGQLRQDRWEQDGQQRSRVTILADNIMLLGGTNDSERASSPSQSSRPNPPTGRPKANPSPSTNTNMAPPVDFEDDIPF
ncbi:single-stranded DNA-binding protein [Entomospira culicis]|uniref:Single-stranded DNA-binding protein n=1 Tax=Entomospira culicis TaxID=2719989 RepID=A0A968GFN4_9SPIO|nr:single-stranded DNA-binding protein [Entomospira culicis]NIZ19426.1 single-stranded DNA-binding protein [Entomospira culicis]NIZ69669.1 single-stranded DNA-binding protein [Entomospira culicis]WDI36779.1 single-stranded DNA-binding protein [Entomospira culicis]WDI38408.1 single-stranded DNA-binding protein [Entomospira culicis]